MEIWERIQTKRGKVRVLRVISLAAAEMQRLLESGAKPRTDKFFDIQPPYSSSAEEIIEAVLLRAEREPEERKLPYQAKLLSYIFFDESIDIGMAHQLLPFAEGLSYRQYCILALATNISSFDLYDEGIGKIGRDKLTDAQTSLKLSMFKWGSPNSHAVRGPFGPKSS
jgi:hypothetical protein